MRICEVQNKEPDPEKMPVTSSAFPEEVHSAFFIYDFLEDKWDGMSGSYLGKSYLNVEYLFNLYNISNQKNILFFIKLYDGIVTSYRADKAEKQRKAEERKANASAGSGKQYAHNVKL